ncbi:hypothetical protein FPS98_30020 [Brevibacillus brevis]|uniref:Copper amine oxidase-like N-terminal domain-containing protein n=1 Tax=Brevibacillus brevis TaxID=1393 RepID=A0A517IG66_BREBE|nr:hypothetical protein FPS98_30020 [Brevibacillus brevis]
MPRKGWSILRKSNNKLAIGLAIVLLLVGGTTVFAKTGTEKISARFSNIKLIVNDQVVKTKAEPFIYNGNVYAPVATVANALGIKQEWDNKTPAVRFSGAGGSTGGSSIPEAIVQQAKDTLPLPCDPFDVKGSLYYCGPEKEVVSKGYVNLTGMSDQEFLVLYRYHTIEGLPWEAYLTLFRQSNGKVVPVNTSKVFDGSK